MENQTEKKWYVVQAHSGFEMRVKKGLEEKISTSKLAHLFGDVMVPQETVMELVGGQKKTTNRKFFPGYVLVNMVLNEDTWHLVNDIPKVSGFVGDAKAPEPISNEEAERLINQVKDGAAQPRTRVTYDKGDRVKVVDGPFAEFNGSIDEVNQQKGLVKVLISIFGRATPVELSFMQIEKV